jgi:hypothetical protein
MADWNLASAAVAIVTVVVSISISPVVLSCLSRSCISIRNLVLPSGNRCQRITREEVSVRDLHICSQWTQKTLPKYAHTDRVVVPMRPDPPLCEHSLPSKFFNMNPALRDTFTKKPPELAYATRYIRMDMWTLGAYLLHWQNGQPRVEIERVGSILVAKVIADLQTHPILPFPTICHLTKNDVDGLLKGYPPFYREKLYTIHGDEVRHPIRNVADVSRGGWIMALGLCRLFLVGKHRMRKPDLGPEESIAPLLYVIRPFKRILEVLDRFEEAFGTQGNLPLVRTMAKGIRTRERSTTSRSEAWFFESELLVPYGGRDIETRKYLEDMTARQCQTAMDAFNHFNPLSKREIRVLRPVLDKVLIAVLHGMFMAAEWDELTGKSDYLEMTGLDTTTRAVYVTESYTEEDA